MMPKKKREKVVAEITATHLIRLMQEQGRVLDPQQAVSFFNDGDRAYIMWMHMMYAGENYIKSVLVPALQSRAATLSSDPAD